MTDSWPIAVRGGTGRIAGPTAGAASCLELWLDSHEGGGEIGLVDASEAGVVELKPGRAGKASVGDANS